VDDRKKTKAELIAELDKLRDELARLSGAPRREVSTLAFLDSVLSGSLCGIYIYDVVEGHNDYINAQYTNITGWTLDEINAMAGDEFAALFHPDDREAVFAHMQQVTQAKDDSIFEIEYRFRTKAGEWIWCFSRDAAFEWGPDGTVIRFIGTFLDISQRKRQEENRREMETRFQQTQRLESLGVLAGGIAHDFNNILMAITGQADLALDEMSPVSPGRETIHDIKKASMRAAELCTQLLAYSGRGHFEKRSIALQDLITEMLHMLKTCISKKCLLNLNMEKGLPCVHGDPSQLRQVVMNLAMNASEAIGERSGVITISTGAMECSSEYLAQNYTDEPMEPGLYVYLEIADTGCGMDRETKQRIFEPFFTTKFTGRGLGLSAVMGIIRAHGGGLRVYSEVDRGTTFKALLPASTEDLEAPSVTDATANWRGTGTALLVDDEETVRAVSGRLLRRLGFEVLSASDGRQAVELYREHQADIVFVLLDLTMPHMNGEETYRALREINPGVCVVLASGYSENDVASRFAGKGITGCLQKPYTLKKVRAILSTALPAAEDSR